MSHELDKIKRDWERYVAGRLRKTLPDYALFHMQRAFFAGSASMLGIIGKLAQPESTNRGTEAIKLDIALLQGEIEDFCKAIIKGQA